MARPRKVNRPTISVMVVKMTLPAIAGSMFSLFMIIGMATPEKAATNKLMIVAAAIEAPLKLFKIDHPLSPDERFLSHASIESSEVLRKSNILRVF